MIGAMLPAKLKRNNCKTSTTLTSTSTNYHCHHHDTTVNYEYFGPITYNFQVQVFVTAVELKHFLFRLPL